MKLVLRVFLALFSALFCFVYARADTAYVWCGDGSIHRIDANGSDFVFPQNYSGPYVPVTSVR